MSQVEPTDMDQPGLRRERIFDAIDDWQAARLLPDGAFELIRAIARDRLVGEKRVETLGNMLSIELAVNDRERRTILLQAVPEPKIAEIEDRTGVDMASLRDSDPGRSVRRALLGFFGAPAFDEAQGGPMDTMTTVTPARALFPHQKRAASAAGRHLYGGEGRAMLHLPTGTGKTRVAMSIVASHLRAHSGLVLWLAATRELLEQAAVEFQATWENVGDRPIDCLRFWATHAAPVAEAEEGIVIAGLAKLRAYGRESRRLWELGDRTSLVVFDEAHQAVAETYRDLVETIVTRKPRTPLLGLSATPGRTWDNPEIDSAVSKLFFENKVMIDFGGANPIRRLTEEGYLASVEFSSLDVDPDVEFSHNDLVDLAEAPDVPDGVAYRLGLDRQRNLSVVRCLLELVRAHRRILVFAASVDNARLLAAVCNGLGLAADLVTAETDSARRERIIRRFKQPGPRPRVLINYGVLTTGFDAPGASAVLIARPTKSLVLYSQMVGRVIRGPKSGGTERCEVVTVVDTGLPGFGDVAEAFTNWEDVWG